MLIFQCSHLNVFWEIWVGNGHAKIVANRLQFRKKQCNIEVN